MTLAVANAAGAAAPAPSHVSPPVSNWQKMDDPYQRADEKAAVKAAAEKKSKRGRKA